MSMQCVERSGDKGLPVLAGVSPWRRSPVGSTSSGSIDAPAALKAAELRDRRFPDLRHSVSLSPRAARRLALVDTI
jgi:hypothetical protein